MSCHAQPAQREPTWPAVSSSKAAQAERAQHERALVQHTDTLTPAFMQEGSDVATVGSEAAQSPARATLYPVRLSQLGAGLRNEAASALAAAAAMAPYVSQARPSRPEWLCRASRSHQTEGDTRPVTWNMCGLHAIFHDSARILQMPPSDACLLLACCGTGVSRDTTAQRPCLVQCSTLMEAALLLAAGRTTPGRAVECGQRRCCGGRHAGGHARDGRQHPSAAVPGGCGGTDDSDKGRSAARACASGAARLAGSSCK